MNLLLGRHPRRLNTKKSETADQKAKLTIKTATPLRNNTGERFHMQSTPLHVN